MEKSHVSLEQKVCIICGKTHDSGVILLDRRLRKSMEMHTVTGYDHCDDCQEKIDDDYIAMIEISNTPSNDVKTLKKEEANRTGVIAWVKKRLADDIFNVNITTPMVFVEPAVVNYLQNLQEEED